MKQWLFFITLIFLSGCVTTSLTTIEYDPSTDTFQEVKYSSHFEGQDYLIDDKLKVLVYADIKSRRNIAPSSSAEDKWEKAEFKIYFSNKSQAQTIFAVNSILFQNHYYSDRFLSETKKMQVVPNTVERIIIEDKTIDKFDKEFKIIIDYTYGTKRMTKEVILKRMTVQEYNEIKPKLFTF